MEPVTVLTMQRRFYAEEAQAICNLRSPSLVEALATVRREDFLQPGPWLIRGEGDFSGPPRETQDADPRHVYHNVSIAIDAGRQLFNGAPGVVAMCIDALDLHPGDRILHVGCGAGYYSALMAQCVGPRGRLVAIEVDPPLAVQARANLAPWPWVEAREGDGTDLRGESYDAMLVSTGMTHPHGAWLNALATGGRLALPLTFTIMNTIGKGVVALLTSRAGGDGFDARLVTMVAIYSAVGIRDAALDDRLRDAFSRSAWPRFNRLRRDPHEPTAACWLHTDTFCFASA
jgi:protein-L-isoaspartate(D-aspartate) O-methyltransferase